MKMAPVVLSGWAADRTPSTSREGITEGEQAGFQLSDSHCRLRWKKIDAKHRDKERWLSPRIVLGEFWENWGDKRDADRSTSDVLGHFLRLGCFGTFFKLSPEHWSHLDCWGIGHILSTAWQRGVKGPKHKWKKSDILFFKFQFNLIRAYFYYFFVIWDNFKSVPHSRNRTKWPARLMAN